MLFGYPRRDRADDLGEPGADRRVLLHPGRARRRLGLLPSEGRDLILAGAILSIMLNPLMFAAVDLAARLLLDPTARTAPSAAAAGARADPGPTELTDHTILIGYGRVGGAGRRCAEAAALPFLVIEVGESALDEAEAGRASRPLSAMPRKPEILRRDKSGDGRGI